MSRLLRFGAPWHLAAALFVAFLLALAPAAAQEQVARPRDARAIQAELDAIKRERDVAAQELVTALLSGQDAAAVARRSGLELADGYTVLGLALARHPDTRNPHVRQDVVARRTLRRVEVELEAACEGRQLSLLGPEGGTVLLAGARSDDSIAMLRERIETVAGVSVTIVVVHATVSEVPTGAQQAHELDVRAAVLLDRRFVFDDRRLGHAAADHRLHCAANDLPIIGHAVEIVRR